MKQYVISLSGHGVESVFMKLSPESYSWWFQKDQSEEFDMAEHIAFPEDYRGDIPDEFNPLFDGTDEYQYWDDNDSIFCHATTPSFDTCNLIVEEVGEDGALTEVFNKPLNQVYDCVLYEGSLIEYNDVPEQVMECHDYQKGTIFGATIEAEEFDMSKLIIIAKEAPNGNEYLDQVLYDREELVNTESCTRGKGMEVFIWEK